MKIKIGSRKSDLARVQAYQVGAAIQQVQPNVEIEFFFKESLGDKNLTDALWKIPERGVFTEDFLADLREERVDLVVHSWKDLPTENRPGVKIAATLPRADVRDMILMRKESWGKPNLSILTSSPRRMFSFDKFLKPMLPFAVNELSYAVVRGNVPTRVKKLLNGEGDILCLAKAGVDRLLKAPQPEFHEMQVALREAINKTYFSILPLSLFPTAPAQGALAIEVKDFAGNQELQAILSKIHCRKTFEEVNLERQQFSGYGGGCHQKIGINVVEQATLGKITYFSGQLSSGEERHQISVHAGQNTVDGQPQSQRQTSDKTRWPDEPVSLFEREPIEAVSNPGQPLFVARANALPSQWKIPQHQWVYCAGTETWKQCASKGVWVNGCFDSLGEAALSFEHFNPSVKAWTKLSHEGSEPSPHFNLLPTYRLREKNLPIPNVTEYFWMSASAFQYAIRVNPSILSAVHCSGPGYTAQVIKNSVGQERSKVFLNFKHWKTGEPL